MKNTPTRFTTNSRRAAIAVGAASWLTLLALPQPALAQSESTAGPQEELTITGRRYATQRALDNKRSSAAILDAVAADDIGKLPVKNAAEAIDYLPGVSLILDQGEGRYVSIRGASPSLNNVTMNGVTVGSTEGGTGRQTPLDVIGGELLKGLEVVKAVTPDMDHQAIGGSVNIQTFSPFDFDDTFVIGSAQIGYENTSHNSPYAASIQGGGRFGEGEGWAFMAGTSYSVRDYVSNSLFVDDWAPAAVADGAGNVTPFDLLIPQQINSNYYTNERERIAFSTALEYRSDTGDRYFARALYSEFTDDERRDRIEQRVSEQIDGMNFTGSVNGQGGTWAETRIVEDGAVDTAGMRRHTEMRTLLNEKSLLAVTLGGENGFDSGSLHYELAYTDNTQEEFNTNWEFRNTSTSGTWNVADLPRMRFTPDESTFDPNDFRFQRLRFFSEDVGEDSLVAKLDAQWDVGSSAYVKTGVYYRDADKQQDLEEETHNLNGTCTLGEFALTDAPIRNKVDGVVYRVEPIVHARDALAFFEAGTPGCFEFNPADTLEAGFLGDFLVNETVTAAYGMVSYDVGDRLNVLGGLRVERTETVADAFTLDFTTLDELLGTGGDSGDAVSRTPRAESAYTEGLPSLHFRYDATDSVVFRAAWTNTIGRPFFADLAPSRQLEFDDDPVEAGRFIGRAVIGNPELEPYTSENLDLSLEYYLGDGLGILSGAVFHKDIDDYVLRNTSTVEDVMFAGRDFSELEINQPINAQSGTIRGIELSYQQQWTSLPGPWSGFGAGISVTAIDSEIDIGGREIPLPQQADDVYTFQIFYQKYGLDAVLSLNHHSKYIDSINDSAFTDLWIDERDRLDFKARYNVNDNVSMFLEWQNILDEPWTEFQGGEDPNLVTGREFYDWTAYIGVSVSFR